jgi:hypothetical protein
MMDEILRREAMIQSVLVSLAILSHPRNKLPDSSKDGRLKSEAARETKRE